ncbi:WD40 repeat family protein [Pelomyxa schiedti]|nr:WD40 repeat family protein [Pelomyxa schiedti]
MDVLRDMYGYFADDECEKATRAAQKSAPASVATDEHVCCEDDDVSRADLDDEGSPAANSPITPPCSHSIDTSSGLSVSSSQSQTQRGVIPLHVQMREQLQITPTAEGAQPFIPWNWNGPAFGASPASVGTPSPFVFGGNGNSVVYGDSIDSVGVGFMPSVGPGGPGEPGECISCGAIGSNCDCANRAPKRRRTFPSKVKESTLNVIPTSTATLSPTRAKRYVSKRERRFATPPGTNSQPQALFSFGSSPDVTPTPSPQVNTIPSPQPQQQIIRPHSQSHSPSGVLTGVCGTVVMKMLGHTGPAISVKWKPHDGGLLASASMDSTVRLWDVFKCQCVRVLPHRGAVKAISWMCDGKCLASGGYDKAIRLTDVETGYCFLDIPEQDYVTSLCCHPSRPELLLCGRFNSGVSCIDLRTGRHAVEYNSLFGQVMSIEFITHKANLFVTSSDITKRNSIDKSLLVWDFDSHVVVSNQVYQEAYTCPCVKIHPSGHSFMAQSHANYIAIFDSRPPFKLNKYKRFEGHQVSGYQVGFDLSGDGSVVATGSLEGGVHMYAYESGRCVKVMPAHDMVVTDVQYHPQHTQHPSTLATCSWDGTVAVFH